MVLKFITSNIHKYEEALLIGEKYEINISHENLEYIEGVKIGVLSGSLLSTLFGYFLLLTTNKK